MESEEKYMEIALAEAARAARAGEIPVGCVIVDGNGGVLARAHNMVEARSNAALHAEMVAIAGATRRLGAKYLMGCSMFVTLEPCPMCAAAIAHVKLARLVFAAEDAKGGAVVNGLRVFENCRNLHRPKVLRGPFAAESSALLKDFFRRMRASVRPRHRPEKG
ncbi:MAG: nucleoside deaminase [Rickettsiales bacterium]|nr:nucleoside deaminase [Rickettsiales bacterium]